VRLSLDDDRRSAPWAMVVPEYSEENDHRPIPSGHARRERGVTPEGGTSRSPHETPDTLMGKLCQFGGSAEPGPFRHSHISSARDRSCRSQQRSRRSVVVIAAGGSRQRLPFKASGGRRPRCVLWPFSAPSPLRPWPTLISLTDSSTCARRNMAQRRCRRRPD
jgi:hypothetical protein